MNSKPFKAVTSANAFDSWLIAATGHDATIGKNYYVITDSEKYSQEPKEHAELIAKLLNEHYAKQENKVNHSTVDYLLERVQVIDDMMPTLTQRGLDKAQDELSAIEAELTERQPEGEFITLLDSGGLPVGFEHETN